MHWARYGKTVSFFGLYLGVSLFPAGCFSYNHEGYHAAENRKNLRKARRAYMDKEAPERAGLFEELLLALNKCCQVPDLSTEEVRDTLGLPDWEPKKNIPFLTWLYRYRLSDGREVTASVYFFEGEFQSVGFRGTTPWDEDVRFNEFFSRNGVFFGKGKPAEGVPPFYARRVLEKSPSHGWRMTDRVVIAEVDCGSGDKAVGLLEKHGIVVSAYGSVTWALEVKIIDAEKAFELLWKDAWKNRYYIRFHCKGGIRNPDL